MTTRSHPPARASAPGSYFFLDLLSCRSKLISVNGCTNVAILLFDDVEALDFCGPFEVFSATKLPNEITPFHVYTCAQSTDPVWARNRLSINPQYPLHNCPPPDVLVVPGGWGTRQQMTNPKLLDWLRQIVPRCDVVLSVCTGALVLGAAGLLDGLGVTTHHLAVDLLRQVAPKAILRPAERVVDNGQIVVAAGVSAGIDAALHIVRRLRGEPAALATAEYMEYAWRR